MWVLQICHSYYPPFLDCARQYSVLFNDTPYKVLTIYLTGEEDATVERDTCSDEVVFFGYSSKQVRGLKLGAIKKIKKLMRERVFQLCIAHRVKPTYIALLGTQLPVISVHHNYNDYSRWSRRLIVNFYKDRVLMLGVSDAVRDDLRRDLGWMPEKIQTLYNRIDVEVVQKNLLNQRDARQQLGINEDSWVLGTAGRLHHDKDYPTLLRGFAAAIPSLPVDSQLVIMGKGPLEAELKSLVNLLGIKGHVKFLGHVANGAAYFKAFDGFVLASDREPFGMVLLEAMSAELPIICTNCGGGAEIVFGVGELFNYGDALALSQIIKKYAEKDAHFKVKEALLKLKRCFSDSSVRKVFWELPYIKKHLKP